MRGFTLVELLFVLTLVGFGVHGLLSTVARLSERADVVAARELLIATLHEARALAVASGGTSVFVTAEPPLVTVADRGGRQIERALGAARPLTLSLGGPDSVQLRFDRLGIGRFASRTIVFASGRASASVVISSYGRVRRR